jgi:hypothetical protein
LLSDPLPTSCCDCLADVVDGFLFIFTLRDRGGKCGALRYDPTIFCDLESNVKSHETHCRLILSRTIPAGIALSVATGSGGVIDDDLPAVVGVLEDEREEAICIAAIFFAPFEAIFSGDDGEVLVEGMDLQIGEGERPHGGSAGVVTLVLVEQAGVAAEDLASDEECVGRVFESADVADEIAFIPGVLLGQEDLDDIKLLARGGVERVWLLRGEEGGEKQSDAESGETDREAKGHEGSRGESRFVWRYREGLSHRTCARSGRIDSSRLGWRW